MNLIEKYNNLKINEAKNTREIPEFKAGDTIDVHVKITDGAASRIQVFKGLCIAKNNSSIASTFTVRRIGANNVGVERIFSIHSPIVTKVEVIRRGDVRRAKLFYIRKLRGKRARIKSELVA
jgi:large subunit ribosomal protein L19